MGPRAPWREASVRRIWHAHGLKPHLVKTFKVSRDPEFADKLEAIVGLYLNPPEHALALVLCVDEKSQIQDLDRTQPGPPLKKGRGQTMTHDINVTARRHCLPPWTPLTARSSASAKSDTGIKSG
jgi:hypothetical protein